MSERTAESFEDSEQLRKRITELERQADEELEYSESIKKSIGPLCELALREDPKRIATMNWWDCVNRSFELLKKERDQLAIQVADLNAELERHSTDRVNQRREVKEAKERAKTLEDALAALYDDCCKGGFYITQKVESVVDKARAAKESTPDFTPEDIRELQHLEDIGTLKWRKLTPPAKEPK